MIKIIGIKITDRIKEAGFTQSVLSSHSDVIVTRLGFHEVTDEVCSREACIILHLKDNMAGINNLKDDLEKVRGIEIREMNFTNGKEELNTDANGSIIEVLGILVEKKQGVTARVQDILTSYGCNIRTRMGVNEVFLGESCGLIILELKGDRKQRILLEKELKKLDNIIVRSMIF